jgi:hypothetical protein
MIVTKDETVTVTMYVTIKRICAHHWSEVTLTHRFFRSNERRRLERWSGNWRDRISYNSWWFWCFFYHLLSLLGLRHNHRARDLQLTGHWLWRRCWGRRRTYSVKYS